MLREGLWALGWSWWEGGTGTLGVHRRGLWATGKESTGPLGCIGEVCGGLVRRPRGVVGIASYQPVL